METNAFQVVCFGETLWDFLPSGKVPGGAPMNVALHLNNWGKSACVVSRIGNDDLGRALAEELKTRGLGLDFIQLDTANPTGKVVADTSQKEAVKYTIEQPSAWDFIALSAHVKSLVAQCNFLVFGSLVTRNVVSKNTLLELLKIAPKTVFDVNLRPPFIEKQLLEDLLQRANIVKLNDEEFDVMCQWFSIEGDLTTQISTFYNRYHLEGLCITFGKDGAKFFNGNSLVEQPGISVQVQDTIGSGDAFLAAFLAMGMEGATPQMQLQMAAGLGAMVAERAGANHKLSQEAVAAFLVANSKK